MTQASGDNRGSLARVAAEVVDEAEDGLSMSAGGMGMVEQRVGAQIERMVAFAMRAPRDVTTFMRSAISSATLNEDIAGSCMYAVPRSGQTIKGPSVRLAEIVATSWRNLWAETTIAHEDERWITARAVVWDVERNTCISVDVRRRITDRKGKRFGDDMIQTTANAAMSIAYRNAVFKVVPAALWRQVYDEAARVVVGDAQTIGEKRTQCLAHFAKMGVTAERVLSAVGAKSDADLDAEALTTLKGYANAIKEGEASIESCFPLAAAAPSEPDAGSLALADKVRAKREVEAAEAAAAKAAAPEAEPKPKGGKRSTGDANAEPPAGALESERRQAPGASGPQASLIDPS